MTIRQAKNALAQDKTVVTKGGCEAYIIRLIGDNARIRFLRSNKLLDYPISHLTVRVE